MHCRLADGRSARAAAAVPLLFLLLMLLGACAAPQYRALKNQPGDLPQQAFVDNVPFFAQRDHYCGPAALAMTLNWVGIEASQAEIAEQVYTPGRDGTLPMDLLGGARRNGALAVKVATLEDLLAEIAAGHPVLVFQNLGLAIWPQWHFAVVIGYDLATDQLILHSGTEAHHVVDLNTFEHTWARAEYWAVTVTAPAELPARAEANAVLAAAAGLERADRLSAARAAYRAILARWPNNLPAHFGLGNTHYSLGQYANAAASFRAALAIQPDYAPAWNNLAYSLRAAGDHPAAIEAARQALRFGGEDEARYRQTLAEMKKSAKL